MEADCLTKLLLEINILQTVRSRLKVRVRIYLILKILMCMRFLIKNKLPLKMKICF